MSVQRNNPSGSGATAAEQTVNNRRLRRSLFKSLLGFISQPFQGATTPTNRTFYITFLSVKMITHVEQRGQGNALNALTQDSTCQSSVTATTGGY